ncbi:hypothetical protein [Streptomyces bobili]|uniref:hypothetical protein n=1 Tax=Streptomyces bobili TaxID=67280 RepID=UPI0037AAF435
MANRMRGAGEPPLLASLPDPQETLTRTDWARLEHAYGSAADAPGILVALLDPDQAVRTEALDNLHGVLHHQNTLYEATAPTALYVAAILPDPRTTRTVEKSRQDFPGNMRAELLAWIASVANEVTDAADAVRRRYGLSLDSYPPAIAIRKIRPLLFTAAFTYADDDDRHVREAAIAACIPLLDDPLLLHRRATLAPLVRQVLGTSELWQHRERAIDALDAWGEDSSGIEGQQNAFLFCDTDMSPDSSPWRAGPSEGFSEEPPF